MTPDGTVTVLHRFTDSLSNATSPLIQATDGNFYGVESSGGAYDGGSVYRMTPDGTVTTLYSFQSSQTLAGESPSAALVQGADGNFYCTTTSTMQGKNSRPVRKIP